MTRLARIKNFIYLHRAKFAAGAVTVAALWLFVKRAEEWNKFLKAHDLYDEFYKFD